MSDRVTFGVLHADGRVTDKRVIRRCDIGGCRFLIFSPRHYRDNGSCKCDDAEEQARMIRDLGYTRADFAHVTRRTS